MNRPLATFLGALALAAVALTPSTPAQATPLLAQQAARSCDGCHVQPNRSDPRWNEASYPLAQRKCRLSCGVCHVNPSGGMLRTAAGQFYGEHSLPVMPEIRDDIRNAVDAMKANGVLVSGLDLRFLDVITDQDDKPSPFFFPMQADLYATARLANHVSVLSQFGLERGGNAAVREAFGLIDNLPYNAYIKFGKFIPPYGHRLEDHTAYVRRELLVDQSNPLSYGAGAEVGAEPLVLFARAAYFNRDLLPRENTESTPHVMAASAGWQGLWLELGGSYLRIDDNDVWDDPFQEPGELRGTRSAAGGFGAVRLGDVVWLFEGDVRVDRIDGQPRREAWISFNELSWRALRGVTLKLRHEYFDPDRDVKDDATQRYGVGVDYHPFPFTEFDMQLRRIAENDPAKQDYYQLLLMVHFWL